MAAAISSIQFHLCNIFVSFPLQGIFSMGNRKKIHGVTYSKAGREPLGCCAWQELPDMHYSWAYYIVKVQKWGIGNNLWGHFWWTISWRHYKRVLSKIWFILWPWWSSLWCTRPKMSKKVISIIFNTVLNCSHFWSGDIAQIPWTTSMLCLWMLVVASSTFLWNCYQVCSKLNAKIFLLQHFTLH